MNPYFTICALMGLSALQVPRPALAADPASQACWDVLAQKEKQYEAVNRMPLPAGATPPLQRVMWMTADSI